MGNNLLQRHITLHIKTLIKQGFPPNSQEEISYLTGQFHVFYTFFLPPSCTLVPPRALHLAQVPEARDFRHMLPSLYPAPTMLSSLTSPGCQRHFHNFPSHALKTSSNYLIGSLRSITLGSCLSWVPYFGNASALGLHLTLDALCHLHKCHYTMSMGWSDTAHTSAPSKKSYFGILLDGQAQDPVHWGSHFFYLFPLIPNGLSFLPPSHLHFSPTYPFPFTSLPLAFPFFHSKHHATTSPLALASTSPSSPLLFLPLRHQ